MKKAFLISAIVEMTFLGAATTASLADDLPALNSKWREQQRGTCLEITRISDALPGPAGCAQIAGRMKDDLMIGCACKSGSEISFFTGLQTDNSIKPDIFIGRYSAEAIIAQFCTRSSNDWPPEYDCKNEMTFKSVSSCKP
ncbi:hypothetical protein [Mesorhizobium neociceri]|uniref:Secreted protein n=1 Tax=Mesorhizobium neociceri TaxID=1307853 RepID=A0A838BDE7_9HYPH|nr:hypothetical protein [Mesorhizobium neociceri]MBA1144089.1 hypothetical protein [Mesorhizobium neociceri]